MANEQLNLSTANEILDHAPTAIFATDDNGNIVWTNQTFTQFFNGLDDLKNIPVERLFQQVLEPSNESPELFHLPPTNQHQQRWLLSAKQDIASDKGQVWYLLDVTEIMRLRVEVNSLSQQLENNSPTDSLTGLLNAKALHNAMDRQVSRSRRYGNPLAIMMITINDFNSNTGKVTQEQVLKGISFFLRDQLRWVDLVGRTADQQFTLVLPETRAADAERLALKIDEKVQNMHILDDEESIAKVNIAVSLSEWRKGDDARNILKRLEKSLEKLMKSSEHVNVC